MYMWPPGGGLKLKSSWQPFLHFAHQCFILLPVTLHFIIILGKGKKGAKLLKKRTKKSPQLACEKSLLLSKEAELKALSLPAVCRSVFAVFIFVPNCKQTMSTLQRSYRVIINSYSSSKSSATHAYLRDLLAFYSSGRARIPATCPYAHAPSCLALQKEEHFLNITRHHDWWFQRV